MAYDDEARKLTRKQNLNDLIAEAGSFDDKFQSHTGGLRKLIAQS